MTDMIRFFVGGCVFGGLAVWAFDWWWWFRIERNAKRARGVDQRKAAKWFRAQDKKYGVVIPGKRGYVPVRDEVVAVYAEWEADGWSYSPERDPIWEQVMEIGASVTSEEWDKVPDSSVLFPTHTQEV